MKNPVTLYQKLYALTEEQKKLIEEKNYEKLLTNLEIKQKVINKINELGLKNILHEDNSNETFALLKKIIENTIKLEKENSAKLQKIHHNLKNKIQTINEREKICYKYKASFNESPKFIDKKK